MGSHSPRFADFKILSHLSGGAGSQAVRGGSECVGLDLQSLCQNSSCGLVFVLCHCIKVHQYGVMQFYISYSVHNCKLFVNSEAMISLVLANLQRISPARTLRDERIRWYSKLSQILTLHAASTYLFCPH